MFLLFCVSEHSPLCFLPPPLPLHKHPASQGSPARLPTLCLISQDPIAATHPATSSPTSTTSTTLPHPLGPLPSLVPSPTTPPCPPMTPPLASQTRPPPHNSPSPTTPPIPTTPPRLPRPCRPARENRKGPAAAALGGSAGSGDGCGAYLGPQPDPWPHAPRRLGRGRGGSRRRGLLTWWGPWLPHLPATIGTTGPWRDATGLH